MTAATSTSHPKLSASPHATVTEALATGGLWLDVGAAVVRVRSGSAALSRDLQRVYGEFPLTVDGAFADIHVDIRTASGLRRWFGPQVELHCDGQHPFEPFSAHQALPLLEWGCNWMIGQRMNHLLLLHAGVVERNGLAMVLPATPGSGKSTLTAALAQRGWRLLSDEFGAFDPETMQFRAMLKPVALKNQSIDVLRSFAPEAVMGPSFPGTRKGTVAHLAPSADAVQRRHEGADAGAIVLPRWQAGCATRFERLEPQDAFPALAFNAFNYTQMGASGFRAAVHVVTHSLAWRLTYSDLDEAIAALDEAWPQVREAQG